MADDAFSVDWMQSWNELQRKIWNDWIAMVSEKIPGTPSMDNSTQWPMQWLQQAMKSDPSAWNSQMSGTSPMGMGGASPWSMPWAQQSAFGSGPASGMDNWMRSFGVYSPEPSPEVSVMNNMAAATDGFMRISKELFQTLQKMGEGAQKGEDWTKVLDSSFQKARDLFSNQGVGQAAMDPMAAWSQPLQMWTDMLKNNSLFSSPLLQSFTGAGTGIGTGGFPGMQGGQSVEALLGQFLSMPGLGVNREKQERMQEGIRDGMAYQNAFKAFQELTQQVNLKALDLMQKKLLERGASNKPLESLRDLYVLLVDCSEEANAEFVRGQEYQEANSRMTNALMRVQHHVNTMMDEMLGALHMPTRRELDSSHHQVQNLKRRMRALEDEVKLLRSNNHSEEINAIRDDMERMDVRSLRTELSSMKKLLESPLSNRAQPEKKVTKPRTATRDKSTTQTSTAAAKTSTAAAKTSATAAQTSATNAGADTDAQKGE